MKSKISITLSAVLAVYLALAAPTSAETKVLTKNCPESFTINFNKTKLMTNSEIRELPDHAKYNEEMLETVFLSRDHLAKLLSSNWQNGEFKLVEKKDGKCTYFSKEKTVAWNRVTLFSTGGKNYLKQVFDLLDKQREDERFSALVEIADYSTQEITLKLGGMGTLYTNTSYNCYDRKCLTDAVIGGLTMEVRSNSTSQDQQ